MTPPECGAPLTIEGGTVIRCTALPGHPDTHTSYYRDRLHQWAAHLGGGESHGADRLG